MRIPAGAVVTACLWMLAVSSVTAQQGTPLACQVEAAGGLRWEQSTWRATRFNERRFVLVQLGPSLTSDSAARAMQGTTAACITEFPGRVSCADGSGGYLLFNPATSRGSIAQLLGGTVESAAKRDTLTVEAFTCERF